MKLCEALLYSQRPVRESNTSKWSCEQGPHGKEHLRRSISAHLQAGTTLQAGNTLHELPAPRKRAFVSNAFAVARRYHKRLEAGSCSCTNGVGLGRNLAESILLWRLAGHQSFAVWHHQRPKKSHPTSRTRCTSAVGRQKQQQTHCIGRRIVRKLHKESKRDLNGMPWHAYKRTELVVEGRCQSSFSGLCMYWPGGVCKTSTSQPAPCSKALVTRSGRSVAVKLGKQRVDGV